MAGADEVDFQDVPPDPTIAQAVGRHHSLVTALADLVDNSIDAGATRVHIRFVIDAEAITHVLVIDDGRGMAPFEIDDAMKYGGKRDYASNDLGHFGLGLKAASLSQADELDVYSRASAGVAVGRRIRAKLPTRVYSLDPTAVDEVLAKSFARLPRALAGSQGTVVMWSKLRTVLGGHDAEARSVWIDNAFEQIRQHLGLVFHRFIADGRVELTLDQFDTVFGIPGPRRKIEAIDPVGYAAVGKGPVELVADVAGTPLAATAHIWPALQVNAAQFRLYGKAGDRYKGFYVYRRDRLLQAGGWNTVVNDDSDLALARVVIELNESTSRHATINPEKVGVEFDATLRHALSEARAADGTTFHAYLDICRRAAKLSRERKSRPVLVAEPGRGLTSRLAEMIDRVAEPVPGGKVDIRWRSALDDGLVDVDVELRTIWLNTKYRPLIGSEDGDQNDAPLLKTLVLLLYSKFYEGSLLGPREREEVKVWDQLLKAALEVEKQMRETEE